MEELTKVEEKPVESTAIIPAEETHVVIASSPIEMANAQGHLVDWFAKKVEACRAELAEAEENLAKAQASKWRTKGWIRRVLLSKQAVAYYEKAKAAVEEGYFLVPDFPVEVIAIRTTARGPQRYSAESTWPHPAIKDQNTNSPDLGEGKYVAPEALVRSSTYDKSRQDGKIEKRHVTEAVDFQPPDFPYKIVKPRILDDTSRAMALKIFDEICVVSKPKRAPDPIVVGRITRRIGAQEKKLSFLISWWIDEGDL